MEVSEAIKGHFPKVNTELETLVDWGAIKQVVVGVDNAIHGIIWRIQPSEWLISEIARKS